MTTTTWSLTATAGDYFEDGYVEDVYTVSTVWAVVP